MPHSGEYVDTEKWQSIPFKHRINQKPTHAPRRIRLFQWQHERDNCLRWHLASFSCPSFAYLLDTIEGRSLVLCMKLLFFFFYSWLPTGLARKCLLMRIENDHAWPQLRWQMYIVLAKSRVSIATATKEQTKAKRRGVQEHERKKHQKHGENLRSDPIYRNPTITHIIKKNMFLQFSTILRAGAIEPSHRRKL